MNTNFIYNDPGRNQFEVGTSERDVFVSLGHSSDYLFNLNSTGDTVVLDFSTGSTSTLTNIETIQFDDIAFDVVTGGFVETEVLNTTEVVSEETTADSASEEVAIDPLLEAAIAELYVSTEYVPPSELYDPPHDDFPPENDPDCTSTDNNHGVIHLSDGDKDVKAEFDFKIGGQELKFKLELKLKDGELANLGEDLEFVDIDTSHLEAAMAEAGVQNMYIDKIEIKDDKIKLEIKGDFALSKQDSENIELYLPNAVDLPISLNVDGEHKEFCVIIEPEFDAHSPIALDMNGDGEIGVTGETSSIEKDADAQIGRTVEFDIDADGKVDTIEWFDGSGDGILVDLSKIKTDGSIDGSALFGDEGGRYKNGYEKLQNHDFDDDGNLTGAELNGLGLWMDDGDAILEDGELVSVNDAGVTEISTNMSLVQDSDGKSLMQSSATLADGTTVLSEDVWFDTAEAEIMLTDMDDFFMDTSYETDLEAC